MNFPVSICATITILGISACIGSADSQGSRIRLEGEAFEAVFGAETASLLKVVSEDREDAIFTGGEFGLWRAEFGDGTSVHAGQFPDADAGRSVKISRERNGLRMLFEGPQMRVDVKATPAADYLDLSARVTPANKTLLRFSLPAQLRFGAENVRRLVFPYGGNSSVGAAFNANFFARQPEDMPSGWRPVSVGPEGYVQLFGAPLIQRADQDQAVPLRVTPAGREWLGEHLSARIDGAAATVNRPCRPDQVDLTLVDSPNGPYFGGSDLGGEGYVWRIGGPVHDREKQFAAQMVVGAIDRLAADAPRERTNIGLISLTQGPQRGGWCYIEVDEWRSRLESSAAVLTHGMRLVELRTARQMMDAADSDDFAMILNPYGEWTPVPEDGGMEDTVRAIGRYVRDGGNWFEVGGYPFYYEMRPLEYLEAEMGYPPAFADFLHLDTDVGSASVYRVQPYGGEPWEGATEPGEIFVPGRIACGGDERGGWMRRPFVTYVEAGDTWSPPLVRVVVGRPADESIRAYCRANRIERGLPQKMSADVLDRFKRSVLVKYNGNCADSIEYMDLLPKPALIHFTHYLRGGFDKQYPDHLPPNPSFGTPEQMKRFFQKAHDMGHLMMPYTNPTWWCDDPKGPTFEREGNAPLARTLDGEVYSELYGTNPGFSICQWHPAVRRANEKTRRQFTEEYPVDILFQDQCGARGFRYDTNPASPTPYAYTEGLLARVAEDSRIVPLSTEGGWDGVVNYEVQLCGMNFGLVPTEGGPAWRQLMKHTYPPRTWDIFPVAQYIAHDKCALIYHDLGAFVTTRRVVSWTLGLGFNLSYSLTPRSLERDSVRQWLLWLDRLQKSVCARYTGQPVVSFEHDRGDDPTIDDDGVVTAQYGDVEIIANLDGEPVRIDGHHLAGYGFYAEAPGMVAANLHSVDGVSYGEDGLSFVTERGDEELRAYVYGRERQTVRVLTPEGDTASVTTAQWPGLERTEAPEDLASRAPVDWPDGPPAIGVIDLGEGIGLHWTQIAPGDWFEALGDSDLCQKRGVALKRLQTIDDIVRALRAGPEECLVIVNPYGELFPAPAVDNWRGMLDMIREYVEHGGVWWETAGYSFHSVAAPADGGWETSAVGPAGMGRMGLPIGSGAVDAPPEPLDVTDFGRDVLRQPVAEGIADHRSPVNRGLPDGPGDPGHRTLVEGRSGDFIGGYRLNGWGWLWRIGGFNPNPDVALPVVIGAVEHIYNNPPVAVQPVQTKRLWSFEL